MPVNDGSAPMRRTPVARRLVMGVAILAVLGVLGVVALLGSLWIEHTRPIALPTPTGAFAVGRTIDTWTDGTHPDPVAPVPGLKRELVVWIWYPSAPEPSASLTGDYLPAAWSIEIARGRGALISKFLTRDLSQVRGHSRHGAKVSPQQGAYPVVIMRAGASAEVANYSTLAEDLASHGYIVVGFDAPYRTNVVVFPDGRVVRRTPENNPEACLGQKGEAQAECVNRLLGAWTADTGFVLDRLQRLNTAGASDTFAGRLDLTRVGVFGHSFGGAAAAQFCHDDPRCQAGIDVDGAPHGSVIQAGLRQPFMFLLSDHGNASDSESRQIMANVQSIYDRLPHEARHRIAIRGASHFLFSDDGAVLKSEILRRALRLFGGLGIDGSRQLAVTTYCVRRFFDAYLKGTTEKGAPLTFPSPLYPEIEVLQ